MEQEKSNKFIITQTQLRKTKENAKFDIDIIKDFANTKRRAEFGHICDGCSFKLRCFKWGNSIIIKCVKYSQKVEKPYIKKNYNKKY